MAAMATSLVTNRKNRTINTYTEDNGSQVSNYLGKKRVTNMGWWTARRTGFGLELEVSV